MLAVGIALMENLPGLCFVGFEHLQLRSYRIIGNGYCSKINFVRWAAFFKILQNRSACIIHRKGILFNENVYVLPFFLNKEGYNKRNVNNKTLAIKILIKVREDFGRLSIDSLRELNDEVALMEKKCVIFITPSSFPRRLKMWLRSGLLYYI